MSKSSFKPGESLNPEKSAASIWLSTLYQTLTAGHLLLSRTKLAGLPRKRGKELSYSWQ